MSKSTNSVPNQNDLFEIFQSQAESLRTLNDIIVKTNITGTVAKNIKTFADVLVNSSKYIIDALNNLSTIDDNSLKNINRYIKNPISKNIKEISKILMDSSKTIVETLNDLPVINDGTIENFNKCTQQVSIIGTTMAGVIDVYTGLGVLDWVRSSFGIMRMRSILRQIKNLMKTTLNISGARVMVAGKVMRSIANTTDELSAMSLALMKVPWFSISSRSVKRLYRTLYGHKPGVPKKPFDAGLIDIFIELQHKSKLKYLLKANWAIGLLIQPTKQLVGVLAIAGVAMPLIAASWISIKLMQPIVNTILFIYTRTGRHLKHIVKGSIGMKLIVGGLLILMSGLVLVGVAAILAIKPMGITILIITGILAMFVLIGTIKPFVKRGYKTILYIAAAVAMLGMVAVTMALLGQFIVANIAGFAIISAYLLMLIGAFALLAMATRFIRKASLSILIVTLCVSILATTAMLVAFVGQFILANIGAMLAVSMWMVTMVGAIVVIGMYSHAIEKSLESLVIIAAFTLVMTGIIALLSVVTSLVNVLELMAVTITMTLLVMVVGGLAIMAGKLAAEIERGVEPLITIAIIAGIMAGVMLILATAVLIANPLIILTAIGEMTLIILAVGALAMAAGALVAGPQAVLFMAGIAALGMISLVSALIGTCGAAIAGAAKKVRDTGFENTKEMARLLNMPFSALIRGDGKESIFNILSELPNPVVLSGIMLRMSMLTGIVSSIGRTADVLQHIAFLNMPDPDAGYDSNTGMPLGYKQMKTDDFVTAAINSSIILGMPVAMFGDKTSTFKLADGTSFTIQPISLSALDNIMPRTRRKIKRLSNIVGYVGSMADTLQKIATLSMPDTESGYNEETGKPKKYRMMKSDDFTNAALNAGAILSFFVSLWGDSPVSMATSTGNVSINPISMSALDNITPRAKRKVKRLSAIVGIIGSMAKTLQQLSSLTVPDTSGPDDFNENGTPKKWRTMKSQDLQNAALVASSMLQFFGALFGDNSKTLAIGSAGQVTINPLTGSVLDNMTRTTKVKIERIGSIVSVVGGMAEILQNLSNLVVPDAYGPEDYNENGTPKRWRRMNDADFTKAMQTAQTIMEGIINVLGDDSVTEKLSNMSKRNIKKLGIAMESIQGLVGIIDVVKALAGGRMVVRWETDNNPNSPTYGQEVAVEYINLSDFLSKNGNKVQDTIQKLIMCPIAAISVISDNKEYMSKAKDASKNVEIIVGVIQEIKGPISDIIDLYNNKLSSINPDEIKESYKTIIQGSIDPFMGYTEDQLRTSEKSLSIFEKIMISITGGKTMNGQQINGLTAINPQNSQNFQNNVKEVTNLIKQIQGTDMDKLKYASNMMSKMAQFSASINGNFKELAQCINEDLITAIEKLEEALGKVGDGIQVDVSTNIGSTIQNPSGTPGKEQKMQPQPKEDPNVKRIQKDVEAIRKTIAQLTFDSERLRIKNG